MAKTKTSELSNVDFIIQQLRGIAESGDSTSARMGAIDRLAILAGVYRVEKNRAQAQQPLTVRERCEQERRARAEHERQVSRG